MTHTLSPSQIQLLGEDDEVKKKKDKKRLQYEILVDVIMRATCRSMVRGIMVNSIEEKKFKNRDTRD